MEKTLEKNGQKKYKKFLNQLDELSNVEEKLRLCLDFMRETLRSSNPPIFRDFWEAKQLCLNLFKEKLPTHVREVFWKEYVELSDEIRHLKEILDEESSFAQEQIQLAMEAIGKDLEGFENSFSKIRFELPKGGKIPKKKSDPLIKLQKELTLLNPMATRLNGLRKELIQTQMRIRVKNRLFEKMSELGDQIFPKRKETIDALSTLFLQEIDRFVQESFDLKKPPFFELKEEIKGLQKLAKMLSIDPSTFSQSREKLSHCWNEIREKEESFKKQKEEGRKLFQETYRQVATKMESLKEECLNGALSLKEAEEKIKTLLTEMKELKVPSDQMQTLKNELKKIKKPLEEKEQEAKKKKKESDNLRKKQREEKFQILLQQAIEIDDQAEGLSLDTLVEKWEFLLKGKKAFKLSGIEKIKLVYRLDSISDEIQEKKWKVLKAEESEESIAAIQEILKERINEKRKIKEDLEEHRKIIGGSTLSLEDSMFYQELINLEKNRLEEIETMIEEIEETLFKLEE